jgi:mono/diheme cytochrome c family protein
VGLIAEQASRGKTVYDDNCGNCHGTNLDNGEFGPPLRGSPFKMHWASPSANALFTYIATRMPPAAPAGLSDRAYSAVEATCRMRLAEGRLNQWPNLPWFVVCPGHNWRDHCSVQQQF